MDNELPCITGGPGILLTSILAVIDEICDNFWLGQCRNITKVTKFIFRNLAQNTAHDFP